MNMIAICLITSVINNSPFNFGEDPRDVKSFNRAITVCSTDNRYKEYPCLSKFLKRENGVYWALCGKPQLKEKGV